MAVAVDSGWVLKVEPAGFPDRWVRLVRGSEEARMPLLCGHTGDPALDTVYSSGLVPGAGGTVITEEKSQNCYCLLNSDSARQSNPLAPRYYPVWGSSQPHSARGWGVEA